MMEASLAKWARGLLRRMKSLAAIPFATQDSARQAAPTLNDEIAATKVGLSTIQQQLIEMRTDLNAMRDGLAGLAKEFAGSGNGLAQDPHGQAVRRAEFRNVARRLNDAAVGLLETPRDQPSAAALLTAFATHLTRSAETVSRSWLVQGHGPADPFRDDDFTIEYAKRNRIYISDEEETPVESGRQTVPWRHLISDSDCAVFLVLGQSNAANHGETRYTSEEAVYTLDFLRMNCSRADDPLPGASGNGGSVWSRLGDRIVKEKLFRRVLFVPLAFGGTFIADWTPHHKCHRRTALALSRLRKELGTDLMPFSGVFWLQGEAEGNNTQMSAQEYKTHFHDLACDLRANGVFAPVFVACATLCDINAPPFKNREAIRAAQLSLPDACAGIFAGPDVDKIGIDKRYDACHLADSGLTACSELWLEVLAHHRSILIKP